MTLTPYLAVADARAAIEWYADALGARVTYPPVEMDDGRVGHVELAVGEARWMMSDEFAEEGGVAPSPDRGSSISLHLGLGTAADVDRLAARVEAAGTPMLRGPVDDEPAGRVAVFVDPFGHRWFLNAPGGAG